MVDSEGTLRRSSAAPTGKGSSVPDLGFMGQDTAVFIWSYRQHGDYDLNGSVTLSDLTPVGMHFGKTTCSPDWQQAQLADGDGNGEVNINDVTPIGQNFNGRVDGYELQSRTDPGAPWVPAGDHAFQPGNPSAGFYSHYSQVVSTFAAGSEYRVVPYALDGASRSYGPESNICKTAADGRCWPAYRANVNRDGRCPALGPDAATHTWMLPLAGQPALQEPVSDMTGTIYVGTAASFAAGDASPGSFYAVNPDGSLRFLFRTLRGIASSAAANQFGHVVVGDMGGNVYCLAPDGKQLWRQRLSGPAIYGGPLIDEDGIVHIVTHVMSGNTMVSSTLCRLDPVGTVSWTRPLTDVCLAAPIYSDHLQVTVVDRAGRLYSFNAAGGETQNFLLADPPTDRLLAVGFLSYQASVIYATNIKSVRLSTFNNTASMPIAIADTAVTMPTLNSQPRLLIGALTAADVQRLKCYEGANLDWAMDLPGTLMSNIAVDGADSMYFGTFDASSSVPAAGNGISCVRPDQSGAWFYGTGIEIPYGVTVAGDGLVVCLVGLGENVALLGISGS